MSAKRSYAAERQAARTTRMKSTGHVRVGIWVPGDVHAHCIERANQLGITLEQVIIRQMRKA